jgi:hypothetical protein
MIKMMSVKVAGELDRRRLREAMATVDRAWKTAPRHADG